MLNVHLSEQGKHVVQKYVAQSVQLCTSLTNGKKHPKRLQFYPFSKINLYSNQSTLYLMAYMDKGIQKKLLTRVWKAVATVI